MTALNLNHPTPFLLIDLDQVRAKYRALRAALPEADVYFAMKANPAARISAALRDEGCGIEVTSVSELCQTLELGVPPAKIITSNPIKEPRFLAALHAHGVDRLAFDSPAEIEKIARHAPDSRVYLRLQTDNTGADWPLSHKFGATEEEAIDLLSGAAARGLVPYGLTFHVGSQCLNIENWGKALRMCARVFDRAAGRFPLEMINLGGGLPIQHTKKIPSLAEIAGVIRESARSLFGESVRLAIEPGRFLVGDAAVLVTSVIGKAVRPDARWLYLDAGLYNGLMETIEQFSYDFDFTVEPGRPNALYTIAGPSCDSLDKMFTGREIPELEVGERLAVLNAGAYTGAYASHFNGFAPPAVLFADELTTVGARIAR